MLLGLLLVMGCAWAGQGQGDNEDARGVEALYELYIAPALPFYMPGFVSNPTDPSFTVSPPYTLFGGLLDGTRAMTCGSAFDHPSFLLQPSQWLFVELQCVSETETGRTRVTGLAINVLNNFFDVPGRPIALESRAIQHFAQLRYMQVIGNSISPSVGPALATLRHLEELIIREDFEHENATTTYAPPDWSFLPPSLRVLLLQGPIVGGSFASFLMSNDTGVVLPKLTELTLHGVVFTGPLEPGLNFSRFPSLTKLLLFDIDFVRLGLSNTTTFPAGFFSPLTQLETLVLDHEPVRPENAPPLRAPLGPGLFDRLPRLSSLRAENVFSFQPGGAFANADMSSRLSDLTLLMDPGDGPPQPPPDNLLDGRSNLTTLTLGPQLQYLGSPEHDEIRMDLQTFGAVNTTRFFASTQRLQKVQLNDGAYYVNGSFSTFIASLPRSVESLTVFYAGPVGLQALDESFPASLAFLDEVWIYGGRGAEGNSIRLGEYLTYNGTDWIQPGPRTWRED